MKFWTKAHPPTLLFLISLCCFSYGILFCLPSSLHAEVIYETYSSVKLDGKPIGYTLQQYELNPKNKQIISISFIRIVTAQAEITESLKAYSNKNFEPISYQYTSQTIEKDETSPVEKPSVSAPNPAQNKKTSDRKEKIKIIDAQFTGSNYTLIQSDGDKKTKKILPLEKGVFLSTFLGYLMLQKGYQIKRSFSYKAIAEEEGLTFSGTATIQSETLLSGQKIFSIKNTFKNESFLNTTTSKGEVLSTSSLSQPLTTEVVEDKSQAVATFNFPEKTIQTLFGKIPAGIPISAKTKLPEPASYPKKTTINSPEKSQEPPNKRIKLHE